MIVWVVGNASMDLQPNGSLRPGGGIVYASLALHALGATPRPLGNASPEAIDLLTRAGIDTRDLQPTAHAPVFRTVDEGPRRQWATPGPPILPKRLEAAAGPVLVSPVLGEAPQALPGGCVVDLQGYTRQLAAPGDDALAVVQPCAPPVLRGVSVVRASIDDVRALGEQVRPEALLTFAPGATWSVLTFGSEGAVGTDGTAFVEARPQPLDVAPLGAGDVFTAAVLLARARGAGLEEAMRLATGTAWAFLSRRLRGHGILEAMPSPDEAMAAPVSIRATG